MLYESDLKDIGTVQITYQDGNVELHYQWIKTPRTFTFPNSFIGDVMLSISANNTDTPQSNTVTVKNIQLELGSTATSYEPFKSNILTVNEEVELRGVDDVKDELNLLTGEYTKAIYEYTFTGDEDWQIRGGGTGGYTYFTFRSGQLPIKHDYKNDTNIPISCDKLPIITHTDFDNGLKHVGVIYHISLD